jgi:hypothetical protein
MHRIRQPARLPEKTEMTTDARNSIFLWVGGLVFFGVFWAALRFDVLSGHESALDPWLLPLLGAVGFINLAKLLWGLRKRRAANSGNPDHP